MSFLSISVLERAIISLGLETFQEVPNSEVGAMNEMSPSLLEVMLCKGGATGWSGPESSPEARVLLLLGDQSLINLTLQHKRALSPPHIMCTCSGMGGETLNLKPLLRT